VILTDDQVVELGNAAMEILEKGGYKILHADPNLPVNYCWRRVTF